MIIKAYELNKIELNKYKLFLFYGDNEGLKDELIKNIIEKKKIEKTTYFENEILKDSDNFIETLKTKSFFENDKIIVIKKVTEKIKNLIELIHSEKINDITIILNSNLLEKKSKIRNFFEKEKEIICIPTYPDTNETLSKLAFVFFKNEKILISQQNINLIVDKCKGDRNNLKNELEKIKIFVQNKKKISAEDLLKLINLSENHKITEIIDNCLAKNSNKLHNILNENNFKNEDCIIILRTFLIKAKKLFKLSVEFEKNRDVVKTIASAKPPIFWKEKEIVKSQILRWDSKSILKLIYLINKLEVEIKSNFNNSIFITLDFILSQGYTDTNN